MALPGDIAIGQGVQYLPGPFDLFAYNNGNPGPVAAIITGINSVDETVGLIIFPEGKEALRRTQIKYYPDTSGPDNGFKKISDILTCGDDVTDLTITDLTPENFTIEFTPVTGNTNGTVIRYRETGSGTWKEPNEAGNLSGYYASEGVFIFTNAVVGTEYDVRVQNICLNNAISTGEIVTGTATAAP
jgi:hypothetical protein